ncbi:hypothetical protein J27TS8_37420 [Robertmurraya siralis]|uniref:Uncharacterized protein n=1 Tax=Robertmurraya siralis TaxID=77777 RepID=A0A919WLE8_9BACI|nr:hypothetical protein J27TS8_37420 [Robertmurraya siralis]
MYRKNCEKCHKPSFSSSEFGTWLCPECGNDLTAHPFFDPVTFEQIFIKKLPVSLTRESKSEVNKTN